MSLHIQVARPSSAYAPYVKYYKYIESDLSGVFKVVPIPYIEMYFNFTSCEVISPGHYELTRPMVHIAGLHSSGQEGYSRMNGTGRGGGFCIVFKPQGFDQLFGIKSAELCQYAVDGLSVFGEPAERLYHRLEQSHDIDEMVFWTEWFFKALRKPPRHNADRIHHIIGYMEGIHGMSSTSEVCRRFSMTQRTLQRTFKNEIGLSPKELMQIFRINHALKMIRKYPEKNLTTISYLSGYYDQSHFIRDIRRITGMAPGKLVSGTGNNFTISNREFIRSH